MPLAPKSKSGIIDSNPSYKSSRKILNFACQTCHTTYPPTFLSSFCSLVRSVKSRDEKLLAVGFLTGGTSAREGFAGAAFVGEAFQGGMFIGGYGLGVMGFVLICVLKL